METLGDKEPAIDIKASTLSHQASMYENIGKVEQAIELNTKGYNMRLEEKPLKGGLGGFEQNLAYNYNTAKQHEKALTWFEKCAIPGLRGMSRRAGKRTGLQSRRRIPRGVLCT